MHGKPDMTCLKNPVYLYDKITMTYLKPTFVWQHYLYHLEKNSRISKLPLLIIQKVKENVWVRKRTIPKTRV
jgi:hypothetical protein